MRSRSVYRNLVLVLLFSCLSSAAAFSDVLYVFDRSGSMTCDQFGNYGSAGDQRIDHAKAAFREFVQSQDQNEPTGLILFPLSSSNACDVSYAVPLSAGGMARVAETIENVQCMKSAASTCNGTNSRGTKGTPLAAAVNRAIQVARGHGQPVRVVVITDGLENCESNHKAAAMAAETARRNGIEISVFVVGFAVSHEAQSELEDLARLGGGQALFPQTGDELSEALKEINSAATSKAVFQGQPLRTQLIGAYDNALAQAEPGHRALNTIVLEKDPKYTNPIQKIEALVELDKQFADSFAAENALASNIIRDHILSYGDRFNGKTISPSAESGQFYMDGSYRSIWPSKDDIELMVKRRDAYVETAFVISNIRFNSSGAGEETHGFDIMLDPMGQEIPFQNENNHFVSVRTKGSESNAVTFATTEGARRPKSIIVPFQYLTDPKTLVETDWLVSFIRFRYEEGAESYRLLGFMVPVTLDHTGKVLRIDQEQVTRVYDQRFSAVEGGLGENLRFTLQFAVVGASMTFRFRGQ